MKIISRILFSESSLYLGGQELQLLLQMSELARRGVEVRLACNPESEVHAAAKARGLPTALALGVPVVASRTGGIPETITQ